MTTKFPNITDKQQLQSSVEFMLKEYDRLQQMRIDTVRQAEQRVSFFLTIASAAIGGLIVLSQITTVSGRDLILATQSILSILLIYGINILNRLAGRQVRLNTIYSLLRGVQDYFARHDSEIAEYLDLERKAFAPLKRMSTAFSRFPLHRGGLVELIIFSNSFLCVGLVLTFVSSNFYQSSLLALWILIMMVVLVVALYLYFGIMKKIHSARLP